MSASFSLPASELERVAVTSSHYKSSAHPLAEELADTLRAQGAEVLMDLDGTTPLAEVAGELQLVISVGGDGTLLATARRLVGAHVPTLGINLGKLGFLAEHSPEEVRRYLRGETVDGWCLSPKMMLQVQLERADARPHYALNDLMVSQGVMTRLIDIEMEVDGQHAIEYRADGFVISTPVGSTAYSLSLGGPILTPGLRAFVVTPIAAHSLTNRPIVLSGSSTVRFELQSVSEEVALVLDGQERVDLKLGDRFTVSCAPTDFQLISSGERSYFDILRQKLAWGHPPRLNKH